jgi:hypothetical protein
VQVAEDVLRSYELNSGFTHSIMPDITFDELYSSWTKLSVDVDEEEVEFARSQWTTLVHDLVGDIQLFRAISTSDLDGAFEIYTFLANHLQPSPQAAVPSLRSPRWNTIQNHLPILIYSLPRPHQGVRSLMLRYISPPLC